MSSFRTPPRHHRNLTPHRNTSYISPSRIDNRAYASSPRSEKKTPGDRFIPNRATGDMDFARYKVASQFKSENIASPSRSTPSQREASVSMREKLLSLKGKSSEDRILSFKQTNAISSSHSKTPGKCEWQSMIIQTHLSPISPLSFRRILEPVQIFTDPLQHQKDQETAKSTRKGSRCAKPHQWLL